MTPDIAPKTFSDLPPEVPAILQAKIRKTKEHEALLRQKGINMRFLPPVPFRGGTVWAVGNRIYHTKRPRETFHEFIIDQLRITLGREWWEAQLKLPFEQRHFIMQCYHHFDEWSKASMSDKNLVREGVWAAQPDGWVESLKMLAFDVISLIHAQKLPDRLIERLKHREQYQGARYEVAVAAIFARLDYRIDFKDENKGTGKRYEFDATHRPTNTTVAVEAKSRARSGVIHEKGSLDWDEAKVGDVVNRFKKAKQQKPSDRPFFIFIDVNAPLTPELSPTDKPWVKNLKSVVDADRTISPEAPASWNAVWFTNYSNHYEKTDTAQPTESVIMIPLHVKFPVSRGLVNELHTAVSKCGFVPNLEPEEDVN